MTLQKLKEEVADMLDKNGMKDARFNIGISLWSNHTIPIASITVVNSPFNIHITMAESPEQALIELQEKLTQLNK